MKKNDLPAKNNNVPMIEAVLDFEKNCDINIQYDIIDRKNTKKYKKT